MDVQIFHSIFDQLPEPVLLRSGGHWLFNPLAEELYLSPADLKQLDEALPGASMWLAQKFYLVRAISVEGDRLYLLRPDTFLSSAADNVCNQLRAILVSAFGSISLLGESLEASLNEIEREHLSNVNRALYQVLRIVTELDRCGTGHIARCQMSSIDLSERLRKLAEHVHGLCAEAGVELITEVAAPSLLMVGDGDQLTYAVLSLISNSLAHMPQQGGRIALSLKEQPGQAVITVSDNAGGFPADLLSDPLWNQPDRIPLGRGLGLGLALARRVAGEHNGTVVVTPTSGGSRVTLSLPICLPDPNLYQSGGRMEEYYPGFSMAKILLSNALPRSLYFPSPSPDEE